jgi:membrane-bound serine protease (ClpP class)
MEPITQLFVILLVCGIMLLAIEVFVPGGVLGTLGTIALLGAIVIAFMAFGAKNGFLAAIGIVVLAAVLLVVWLNIFPKTGIGKKLTLSQDGKAFKSGSDKTRQLLHAEGITLTELHPSGLAEFDGQRVDVVTNGSYIARQRPVKVIAVRGNHITVAETESEA